MRIESNSLVAQTGIYVVQLPNQVSSEIDLVVDDFASGTNKSVVQYAGPPYVDGSLNGLLDSTKRWQGADLWIISTDSQAPGVSITTRRVTISAFSDLPDMLVFIPDIIVTSTNGKFMLSSDTPDWVNE